MNSHNSLISDTLQRYTPEKDSHRKRVLMISESNSLTFLEEKFREHPDYEVINESIEAIQVMGVRHYIEAISDAIKEHKGFFDGVTGFFDTPNAIAAAIAHLSDKIAPPLESIARCQNKLYCRMLQQESVPEHTPAFASAEDYAASKFAITPVFAKPVRAAGSFGCAIVHSAQELHKKINNERLMLQQFNQPYIEALTTVFGNSRLLQSAGNCNQYLCEEIIAGRQFAVNGYIVNGEISLHGIVAEYFLPNSKSFEYHECPADLPDRWRYQIERMVQRFVAHTGLDNTEFDIEFYIDFEQDKLTIIEINPRAVVQYENLYAMASGDDMLTTMCALACGDKPPTRQASTYSLCYSCELRTFEDQHILETPDTDNLSAIYLSYPDIKIVNRIPPGIKKLSESKRSIDTYRYCMISIPGNSREEILNILADIKQRLNYRFSPA